VPWKDVEERKEGIEPLGRGDSPVVDKAELVDGSILLHQMVGSVPLSECSYPYASRCDEFHVGAKFGLAGTQITENSLLPLARGDPPTKQQAFQIKGRSPHRSSKRLATGDDQSFMGIIGSKSAFTSVRRQAHDAGMFLLRYSLNFIGRWVVNRFIPIAVGIATHHG